PYSPAGDQPEAIDKLVERIERGEKYSTLLGVTGSGKTFTVANLVQRIQKPTLVISHNKTLAAQLFGEFSQFFPMNAIEYFISYYDYYQPEAYIPSSDTYIEKDADINEDIDRLRLRATTHLIDRRDTLIVSSVSCIYGLGNPEDYAFLMVQAEVGGRTSLQAFARKLVDIHYVRNEFELERGSFRIRGDVLEILPAYERDLIRIEFFGDEVERIVTANPLTGEIKTELDKVSIYPAKHFVTTTEKMKKAVKSIREELAERLAEFRAQGKLLEAQRLEQRTYFDIEMMLELGYVSGIENYSRHLSGREPGSRPWCLLDYFPKDFFVVIDESHVTIPQIRAMFNGDRSRKGTLVEYGFRLPSALDNRPLKFEEFLELAPQILFVSATPSKWEIEKSGEIVEQLVRPTGLIDPEIEVRTTKGQVENLLAELRQITSRGERALVTTLTKKMAEDLSDYLSDFDLRVRYMHSEIDAIERVEILRDLRLGNFDVLIGVNLLREGLDLPEVTLVAIMDADKEGFLRSETSLVQTAGRAARNIAGKVILYADRITDSMARAMEETDRRRQAQIEYNIERGITPKSILKSVDDVMAATGIADSRGEKDEAPEPETPDYLESLPIEAKIDELERMMNSAAKNLEFEQAAFFRDEIRELEKLLPDSRKSKKKKVGNPHKKITRFY
ncbi:MAG TPA: excinuclease ABC subunit UvrB, partial [candidate division Zixibacteria bacterium]|nr:excinuclease ABC subunit UvrB [candidate division Zixibacteria bacterium]